MGLPGVGVSLQNRVGVVSPMGMGRAAPLQPYMYNGGAPGGLGPLELGAVGWRDVATSNGGRGRGGGRGEVTELPGSAGRMREGGERRTPAATSDPYSPGKSMERATEEPSGVMAPPTQPGKGGAPTEEDLKEEVSAVLDVAPWEHGV